MINLLERYIDCFCTAFTSGHEYVSSTVANVQTFVSHQSDSFCTGVAEVTIDTTVNLTASSQWV